MFCHLYARKRDDAGGIVAARSHCSQLASNRTFVEIGTKVGGRRSDGLCIEHPQVYLPQGPGLGIQVDETELGSSALESYVIEREDAIDMTALACLSPRGPILLCRNLLQRVYSVRSRLECCCCSKSFRRSARLRCHIEERIKVFATTNR